MNVLLDTNLICERTKARPDPGALSWLDACPPDSIHLSTISIAEISYGIARLGQTHRGNLLRAWRHDLVAALGRRILPVTSEIAALCGDLRRQAELDATTMPIMDAFLAATAQAHDLTLVTRNSRDFRAWGGSVINPWSDAPDQGA